MKRGLVIASQEAGAYLWSQIFLNFFDEVYCVTDHTLPIEDSNFTEITCDLFEEGDINIEIFDILKSEIPKMETIFLFLENGAKPFIVEFEKNKQYFVNLLTQTFYFAKNTSFFIQLGEHDTYIEYNGEQLPLMGRVVEKLLRNEFEPFKKITLNERVQ